MTVITLDHADPRPSTTPSERLRLTTAAVRVSFTWLGVRKTLTPEQKSRAAESFGAERDYLSARKKLLDTSHPAYKEVSAIRGRVNAYWRCVALPYPEPGVRLIRQDMIDAFNRQMLDLKTELEDAVARLEDHYAELKEAAQRRLGDLFNPTDYPPSLRGLFDLAWDFPNVQPPDYLLQLNPAIYEQEKARIANRFEEAVRLAEQAFTAEFAKLVSHLTERLSSPDGERKIFRDSAVANLTDFFQRFRQLNIHSSEQLDALVQQAQNIVHGVRPQELRGDSSLRQHIATELAGVQAVLDGMLIDRPRRRIIRNQEVQS
jgi:hypothetical protein